MGGAFSYASFSRGNGRAGGWGVGSKVGDISSEELQELITYVPTTLNTGTRIPDFPSAQERAELVHRTAVFTLTEEGEKWVTMVSVPAGIDATGRGGNVFTYTCVTDGGIPPAPAQVLFSPDVPTPFSIFEVDKVQIPEKIVRKGPLAIDALIDDFLAGEFQKPATLPAPFKSVTPNPDTGYNARLVSAMAQVLSSKKKSLVVLVAPENQAALWIAATAREVGEQGFGYSTFEKPAGIAELPLGTSTMVVVPEREKLRLMEMVKAGAIPGNPVVFVLGASLPDISAYDDSAVQPQQSTVAEQSRPFGEPQAPAAEASPFLSEAPRSPQPTGFAEQQPLGSYNATNHNPFADVSAAPTPVNPAPETPKTPESTVPVNPAPVHPPVEHRASPSAAPRPNAWVPPLTQEEIKHLYNYDPAWWLEYLNANRGRAIHLAILDRSCYPEGYYTLALAAAIASWVQLFESPYKLLVREILRGLDDDTIAQARALVVERFTGVIKLDRCRMGIDSQSDPGRFIKEIAEEIARNVQSQRKVEDYG